MKNKIPTDFVFTHFKLWLEQNQHRFHLKPIIFSLKEDSFFVKFENVPNIKICFSKYGKVEIIAFETEKSLDLKTPVETYWDILVDFDLIEKNDSNGYFCELCQDKVYFKDRESLWISHAYEPLLKWVNEKIISENSISFWETKDGGAFGAKILKTIELENDKMKDARVKYVPMLVNKALSNEL